METAADTYTFVCDWLNYMTQLTDCKFAVVTHGETYQQAVENAAKAVLDFFPNVAEYATPKSLWNTDNGVVRIAEFYGDVTASLVDLHAYDIIRTTNSEIHKPEEQPPFCGQ
ncbi:hypothetical protein [Streptomyces sp. VRA16 Mangrove soil]|uniref:hypothetical protein n=1 Tax=Streptomyces sp. VRA16 Mangrove soil TaxID=2817434 RepID=UPI001A9D6418|nr:hypothetical protein [Streptomyces sp. VRA16 Mangrove soil]MBO1332548.1 hypothetical protein [Streptomyces sp. VRA16 Mangrove soil]